MTYYFSNIAIALGIPKEFSIRGNLALLAFNLHNTPFESDSKHRGLGCRSWHLFTIRLSTFASRLSEGNLKSIPQPTKIYKPNKILLL
jgi:hypothetical protein